MSVNDAFLTDIIFLKDIRGMNSNLFLKKAKKMDRQIELLCKKLKAHSVGLVYTPCNRNITNPHVHKVWRPWQIIAKYNDDSQTFFRFSEAAEEAIKKAIKHDHC